MTLENDVILGTMFPIQISTILKKSNATWGCDEKELKNIEGQLAFSLMTYLGGMHIDGHAPTDLTEAVVQLLHRYGLPEYLKATSSLYDLLVRSGSFDFSYPTIEMETILPGDPNWFAFCNRFGNWRNTPMMKAWALRFLKRFTVKGASSLLAECLRDFVATDRRNKMIDRRDNCYLNSVNLKIEDLARVYLEYLLAPFNADRVLNSVSNLEFFPTSNSVNNCCSDPRHRVGRVLAYLGLLPSTEDPSRFNCSSTIDLTGRSTVHVSAVPKDYKSYRIVSPDDPINLAFQQAIVDEVNRCLEIRGLKIALPLHDQEIMRALTYATTTGGQNYATLDLSRASDTVRLFLARRLFPTKFMTLIDKFRPTHFDVARIDVERRVLYMLAPMGSAFTLLLQSLVFWALDCATCQYCAELTDQVILLGKKVRYRVVTVYPKYRTITLYPFSCKAMGDDQQVPQEFAEACIDTLQRFGFIVNVTKSFFDELAIFRESCGAEALGDEPIDGFYIPRHNLSLKGKGDVIHSFSDLEITDTAFWNDRDRSGNVVVKTTSTAIIALCKTFQVTGLPNMATQIQRWLAATIPGMTVSETGSPADDLWGAQDIVHSYRPLPMAKFVDIQIKVREYPFFLEKEVTKRKLEKITCQDQKMMRPVHWAITSKRKKLGDIGTLISKGCPVCQWVSSSPIHAYLLKECMESYRYQQWLQKGPNYQSEIDRLLGTSAPTPGLDVISKPVVGNTF